jgi:hypothetical protein
VTKPTITFKPSGRGKARCAPNTDYPHGIAIDGATPGAPTCMATLPYPAPECGCWLIECDDCDLRLMVTAAGRADDPVSVRFDCPHKPTLN